MEVKKGFKQTEVGVIPEDWEVRKLGEIADIKTGPFGSSLHEKDYVEDGTPIITVEHLGERGVVHQNLPMVSDFDRKRLGSYSLKTDDIVFSRVGSVDRNSLISKKENGWLFSGRLLRIRINYDWLSPTYLSYYFHQEPTKQRIRSVAVGQTMASLNTEILKNISVAVPPTKAEQTDIATSLSDTDALIHSLEKLIAKKRNIKQGAMQELLKPKEGWVVKKLGEIFTFHGGFTASREQLSDDGYCYLHYGDIHGAKKTFINVKSDYADIPKLQICLKKVSPKSLLNEGDIVFVDASEDDEGTSRHIIVRNPDGVPYISGLHTIVAKSKDDSLDIDYKCYCFHSDYIKSQFKFYAVGTKVSGISKTNIAKIELIFPNPAEQTRIAAILSDMDGEIEALEKKLDKYKMIKQGMMQELLTGKTRLI
jgi:type I restriction enzyme S subunit